MAAHNRPDSIECWLVYNRVIFIYYFIFTKSLFCVEIGSITVESGSKFDSCSSLEAWHDRLFKIVDAESCIENFQKIKKQGFEN